MEPSQITDKEESIIQDVCLHVPFLLAMVLDYKPTIKIILVHPGYSAAYGPYDPGNPSAILRCLKVSKSSNV